ncbi:MAG: hypothetical protein GEU82_08465 [Luteitalea sp.]|nr:hypothetical protein [Luteitalea sp.]
MTRKPRDSTSILVRSAIFVGRIAGTWRRRQHARDQDAFVTLWKEAWVQGCEAAWAGRPLSAPAGLSDPQGAAWTAGWRWAQTQPDRRRPSLTGSKLGGRRTADTPRPLVRAAKGGAAGLVVFAAARWLMGARRSAAGGSQADPPQD